MRSDKSRARWRSTVILAVSLAAATAPHAAAGPARDDAATHRPANSRPFLGGLVGARLGNLDGSSVLLTASEGGFVRTITSPDGIVKTMDFVFLAENLGTISETDNPAQVSGVFHVAATGVSVDYADGRSELLAARGADGLTISVKSAGGEYACATWYLPSHVFTADDKKAAVAAYARRLGVASGSDSVRAECVSTAAISGDKDHPAVPSVNGHRKPTHVPREAAISGAPQPTMDAKLSGLQTVPVKQSNVHLIDAAPTPVVAEYGGAVDERIASNCLKVESDGNYWGFRNHCGYSVQFAYCLLHGSDEMTACAVDGSASVSGSVSSNGFGPLFADASLGERDVEHSFRWVGCRGGAGEVIAHLDQPEPASGRCVRNSRTLARDN